MYHYFVIYMVFVWWCAIFDV